MIGQLTGRIVSRSPAQLLLDVNGVGYELHIPLSTFCELAASGTDNVSLHVHTRLREDALQLFGFASREERAAFVLLIGISGVGPRMALAILSGIGVRDLERAVHGADRARLQQIPGVGRKTAERLLLELKDKLPAAADGPADLPPRPAGDGSGWAKDALSALVNLGYTREVATRAVDRVLAAPDPAPASLEQLLRRALAGLVR